MRLEFASLTSFAKLADLAQKDERVCVTGAPPAFHKLPGSRCSRFRRGLSFVRMRQAHSFNPRVWCHAHCKAVLLGQTLICRDTCAHRLPDDQYSMLSPFAKPWETNRLAPRNSSARPALPTTLDRPIQRQGQGGSTEQFARMLCIQQSRLLKHSDGLSGEEFDGPLMLLSSYAFQVYNELGSPGAVLASDASPSYGTWTRLRQRTSTSTW